MGSIIKGFFAGIGIGLIASALLYGLFKIAVSVLTHH